MKYLLDFIVLQLLLQRQFGPSGFRPPTCGGPASNYVCCRVSVNGNGHTVFIPNEDGRDHAHGNSGLHASPSHVRPHVAVGGSGFRAENNNNNNNNGLLSSFNNGLGQCGRRNAHGINGRVAAGRFALNDGDTDFAEYPWQVAILRKEKLDNVYLCGGSLIDGSHILTAAHCIKDYRPDQLRQVIATLFVISFTIL